MKQITNPRHAVGKTIAVIAWGDHGEVLIKFTDDTFVFLEAYDDEDTGLPFISMTTPLQPVEFGFSLVRERIITQAEMDKARDVKDAGDREERRRQFEYLKREFEGK